VDDLHIPEESLALVGAAAQQLRVELPAPLTRQIKEAVTQFDRLEIAEGDASFGT